MAWKIIDQQYLEKNDWVCLRKDSCETPAGVKIEDYYIMELNDVASVVALTKDNEIVLVQEYKHGVQKEVLQIPSGYVDDGEDALEAAKRELLEETGYGDGNWVSLGKFTGSPGKLNHYYHFFLVTDVEKVSEPKQDAIEDLTVSLVPFSDVEEVLKTAVTDMASPAAILFAKNKLL